MNQNILTLTIVAIFVALLMIPKKKCREGYCPVAQKFDHIHRLTLKDAPRKSAASTASCTGDYISVAPKRDVYYQPEQGRLGENILSGFPYYKAY